MKEGALTFLFTCILAAALGGAAVLGYQTGRRCPVFGQGEPLPPRVDTLFIRDTVKAVEAKYIAMRVVDSVMVPITDTIRMRDTLYIYMERTQVTWEDSLARVYASGINPQVDSVLHFRTDQIITKEVPVIRPSRWGLGIHAGLGAGKEGFTPYVGVGVHYNILSW